MSENDLEQKHNTNEMAALSPSQLAGVHEAIAAVQADQAPHRVQLANGDEAYAYPGAGIHWGVNGGAHGINIARARVPLDYTPLETGQTRGRGR
jgi:hypothetical protein